MIRGNCDMKIGGKCEFLQASFWFTLINQLSRQKGTCSRNYKSRCNLPFVIKLFNGNIFWLLWWKCVLHRRDIRKGCLVKCWRDIMIQYNIWNFSLEGKFFFKKNFLEGSPFPAVPFLLVQFIDSRHDEPNCLLTLDLHRTPLTKLKCKRFKVQRGGGGACCSKTKYIYTIVPWSFAFTTPVPMAFTILEMTVPARCEPIITSFVLFRNSSDIRFGRPIF